MYPKLSCGVHVLPFVHTLQRDAKHIRFRVARFPPTWGETGRLPAFLDLSLSHRLLESLSSNPNAVDACSDYVRKFQLVLITFFAYGFNRQCCRWAFRRGVAVTLDNDVRVQLVELPVLQFLRIVDR
uniref:(northern house mosquito) hypothetical protein n=1 Tax=Culex pipiens TaxID=7175 RepID=A0A8D8PJ61_CULPI